MDPFSNAFWLQFRLTNTGVVRVGKNKYLTRDNEDLIFYLQEKGYKTKFFCSKVLIVKKVMKYIRVYREECLQGYI